MNLSFFASVMCKSYMCFILLCFIPLCCSWIFMSLCPKVFASILGASLKTRVYYQSGFGTSLDGVFLYLEQQQLMVKASKVKLKWFQSWNHSTRFEGVGGVGVTYGGWWKSTILNFFSLHLEELVFKSPQWLFIVKEIKGETMKDSWITPCVWLTLQLESITAQLFELGVVKLSLSASTELGGEDIHEVKIKTGPVLVHFNTSLWEATHSSSGANPLVLLESYSHLLPAKIIVELPTLAMKATLAKYEVEVPLSYSAIVATSLKHQSHIEFQMRMDFHTQHDYDSTSLETLIVHGFSVESIIPFQLQSTLGISLSFKEIGFGITSQTYHIIRESLTKLFVGNNRAASNPLKISLNIEKLVGKLILQNNKIVETEVKQLIFELNISAFQLNIKTVSVTNAVSSEMIISSWFRPDKVTSSNMISVNASLGDGRHALLELLHVSIDPIEFIYRKSLIKSMKLFLKQEEDMQNQRKGKSKSLKLRNVFISRIELLVTYNGFIKSRCLIDSCQFDEFDGTYKGFTSELYWKVVRGVLKTCVGMQGRKFTDASGSTSTPAFAASSSSLGTCAHQPRLELGNDGSLNTPGSTNTSSPTFYSSSPIFDHSPEGTPLAGALPVKRKSNFLQSLPKRCCYSSHILFK